MYQTFDDESELRYAIWESKQTEEVKQLIIAKRSKCIEDFCTTKNCTTDTVLEQGDCAIISTFLQLQRPHTTSNINMYRQKLSKMERLNPNHYFHLSLFGGPHLTQANKQKMLFKHARQVIIPGTLIEQIDYQAISNLERAIITLYCIIVETDQELDVQVFLPSSGAPLRCLNYLLLITAHPVGSHVQPIYFSQASQQISEDIDADAFEHDLIKMVQPIESHVVPITVLKPAPAHPVGSHVQPIYFSQASQQMSEDIDADAFEHDLIKMVQPIESHVVPITVLKPARKTLQDVLSEDSRKEIVSRGSSSTQRLLKSSSFGIFLLPLLFLVANFIIALLDSHITPAFTAALRCSTRCDVLSPLSFRALLYMCSVVLIVLLCKFADDAYCSLRSQCSWYAWY